MHHWTTAQDLLDRARADVAEREFAWADQYASTEWQESLQFYPDIPMPPEGLVDHIRSRHLPDFRMQAWNWLALLEKRGLLRPDMTMLDVGCAYGRMAYAFRAYLDEAGRYISYDVYEPNITFLQKAFAVDERFWFFHLDLVNARYNPNGAAQEVRWPVHDGTVDLCLALSVFTHIDLAMTRATLAEAQRVLVPGGILFATVFRTERPWQVTEDAGRTVRLTADWLRLFEEHGLQLVDSWGGEPAEEIFENQWVVVCRKEET